TQLRDPGRRSHGHRLGRAGLHHSLRVQPPALRARHGGHGAVRQGHRRQPMVRHPFASAAPRWPLHHLRPRRSRHGRRASHRPGRPHPQGGNPRMKRPGREPLPAPNSPPLGHPAMLLAALAAAASIVISASFALFDPDLFQHLLVGKVIWQTHAVPTHHLWTWPSYGQPEVLPSWLFRALVWPFWSVGGVVGLFVWRWLTALAAFGLVWLVARRLGARGLTPLVVIAVCALVYRQRSMVRPETLVAVLLALELWILETRRQGGP